MIPHKLRQIDPLGSLPNIMGHVEKNSDMSHYVGDNGSEETAPTLFVFMVVRSTKRYRGVF